MLIWVYSRVCLSKEQVADHGNGRFLENTTKAKGLGCSESEQGLNQGPSARCAISQSPTSNGSKQQINLVWC
jgi:hypothetical protein